MHLDTDLGSDTDDLCALAMLLGWPGIDLAAVTTNTDPGGRRAGDVEYALRLAGREDVPVAAGAEGTLGHQMVPFAFPDYWPEPVPPRPAPPGAATDLLAASAEAGATIVAIGPYTNLAMVEAARPGLLRSAGVVVMGGHVTTPRPGLPPWGAHDDFNVQQDPVAARVVFERCDPLVVPLAVTLEVTLRSIHLPRLRAAGPLGALLADQAEAHARDNSRPELGRTFEGLPDDLLNFQYDPLACAVAAGWDGIAIEEIPTLLERRGDRLWMVRRRGAAPLRVVTAVDAPRFEEAWLEAVIRASSHAVPS
ncbi:MAG: nucleoside hydrolase [Actinomycetota bacterium]